jgi:hypothetical protein
MKFAHSHLPEDLSSEQLLADPLRKALLSASSFFSLRFSSSRRLANPRKWRAFSNRPEEDQNAHHWLAGVAGFEPGNAVLQNDL